MASMSSWLKLGGRCPGASASCAAPGPAAHRRGCRPRRQQQAWPSAAAAAQHDDDGPSTSGSDPFAYLSLAVSLRKRRRCVRVYARPASASADATAPMQATPPHPASSISIANANAAQTAAPWPRAPSSPDATAPPAMRRPRLIDGGALSPILPSLPSNGHHAALSASPPNPPSTSASSAATGLTQHAGSHYTNGSGQGSGFSSGSGSAHDPTLGLAPDSKLVAELEAQVRSASSVAELQQLLLTFRRPVRPPAGSSRIPMQLSPAAAAVAAAAAATGPGQAGPSGGVVPAHVFVLMMHQLSKVQAVPGAVMPAAPEQVQELQQHLLRVLDPALPSLSGYHMATLLASMARMRQPPQLDWLERFLHITTPQLKDCGAATLTAFAAAVAHLPLLPWDLKGIPTLLPWLDALLLSVRRQLPSFRGEELVKMLEALGRIKFKPREEWLSDYTRTLRTRITTLDSAHLSRGIAAFAALNLVPDDQLLRAYYMQLYAKLPLFDDQELSTTAEAFAALQRVVRHSFLDEFLQEAILKLPTFKQHSLGNLLRALGAIARPKLEQQTDLSSTPAFVVPQRCLAVMGRRVEEGMSGFTGIVASNCVWGLAMLGYKPSQQFMDKFIEASHLRMHELHTGPLSRMLVPLTAFRYKPQDRRAAHNLRMWYEQYFRLVRRRSFDADQVCHMLNMLVLVPQQHVTAQLISSLLASSCLRGNPRNIGPARLVGLAQALQVLQHRPPFFFTHMLTQTARCHWSQFTPQEYADLLDALCFIGCPATLDTLWINEFVAVIQCRLDQFSPAPMARLLGAVVRLPGIKPSAQWLALVVSRVQQTASDYTAAEMCDILVALARCAYRPPPEVFDALVQHVTANADTLPAERAAELSDALMALVPGYLGGADGHEQYQALQLRLRAVEVPARVVSHAVPSAQNGPGEGGVRGGRGGIQVAAVGKSRGPVPPRVGPKASPGERARASRQGKGGGTAARRRRAVQVERHGDGSDANAVQRALVGVQAAGASA